MLKDFLAKKPKKHLIFDLDNTLVKLHIDWTDFRKVFFELVGKLDPELLKIVPNKTKMGNILYSKAVEKHGGKMRRKLLAHCEQWETSKYSGFTPNQELVDFVFKNREKYTFYIWTSNNRKTAELVMKDLPVADAFTKVVAKEDVQLLKPYPDGFKLIFDPRKARREEFLMIGDNSQDEGAAKNAGIDYYQVEWDFY